MSKKESRKAEFFQACSEAAEKGGIGTDKREHIGFYLRVLHNRIDAKIKESGEASGFCVTQIQHWIIHFLMEHQDREIFQRDLEEEFHVSRATISSTLQVMERNGLILRNAVESDARLKKLSLTPKSLEFSRRAQENVVKMEECLSRGMTPQEREELLGLLRRVLQNLEEK